jgi:hypothetical protein
VEPQRTRDAPRENGSSPDEGAASAGRNTAGPGFEHLTQTITAYTTGTRNTWLHNDTVSYLQHCINRVPIEKVKNVIQTVHERAECRINSFAYFVKEILATNDPRTLGGRRKALAAIVKRVRDVHQGRHGYSIADLVFDVKAACARESVIFDNDLFNDLVKR